MPLLDFECPEGHRFEQFVSLSEISIEISMLDGEVNRPCKCGAKAKQIFPRAPAMHTPTGASARADEETYREHNITRHQIKSDGLGGTIEESPISHTDGCQCPACKRTVRRAAVTVAAEPGKEH